MADMRAMGLRTLVRPTDIMDLESITDPLVTGSDPGAAGYTPSPHTLDSAHHTGTIGNTQAPQFAYVEGSGTDRSAYNANRMTAGLAHVLPNVTDTYDIGDPTKWWRSQYVSQINAAVFAENVIQLLGGWFIVGHAQGTLQSAVATGSATADFGTAMTPNDFVLIKSHDTGSAVKTEYMQVGTLVSGTTYNVTRDVAAAHGTDPAWAEGTPWLNLGYTGDGRIEFNAYDTPRMQMFTQGATYNAQTEVLRVGDLNAGWGYVAETYGVALGEYGASKVNLTMDPTNGLRIRNNTTVLGQWAADGSLVIGEVAADKSNVYITAGAVYIRNNTTLLGGWLANGVIVVGETANSKNRIDINPAVGVSFIYRNASAVDATRMLLSAAGVLSINDSSGAAVFTFDASAGAEFTKPLTLGSSGGIYQGTGTFASPTTGLKIYNSGGVGLLEAWGAGTKQAYLGTDGKLYAGAGVVTLDANGITITEGQAAANSLTWKNGAATVGTIWADDLGSTNRLSLESVGVASSGEWSLADLGAFNAGSATAYAQVNVRGQYGDATQSEIECKVNDVAVMTIKGLAVYIYDTANAKSSIGLTINQDTADDEILALKSSDVAHGITDITETDTYGYFKKLDGVGGGVYMVGLCDTGTVAVRIDGVGITDDTTKTTAGRAYVEIGAAKKSGTGVAAPGADANVFGIRYGSTTRFIVDSEGDIHYDGTANTYDEHDDALACRDLSYVLSRDRTHRSRVVRYNPEALEAMGLVTMDGEAPWVSDKKARMLTLGAIGQLYERLNTLERGLVELKGRVG